MVSKTILDILAAENVVTLSEAEAIRNEARASGRRIEDILISRNIHSDKILKAKSALLGIPIRVLKGTAIPYDVLEHVPEESARQYEFIPLAFAGGVLEVGMVNPQRLDAREALQFISSGIHMPVKIFLVSRDDFEEAIKGYKSIGGEVQRVLVELKAVEKEEELKLPKGKMPQKMFREEAPITKTVTVILRHAIEGRASDVHIEPGKEKLRVRFRVDGVLYTSILLPMNVHDAIISRIKIMTNLKIDEKRVPQDGRFKATIGGRDVDFRVSTFPTYFGEKAAIRVLDPSQGIQTLEKLGFNARNRGLIEKALKRPFGLVLITGPTGSGKSTTLYAMMQIINDEKRNIISLEDPIEYYMEGLNQSQMRPEIGYSFASGLRSVLRQDPDVIMVGEIRDKETAQLAIHAALTGHLVLSTLHTNNALGVIPRLIDMGVDPFLIPSTLALAIAQRLTRTLCKESRKELLFSGKVRASIEKELEGLPEEVKKAVKFPKYIYEAKPSPACPKGTRGRTAISEVISMTDELEEVILKGASETQIEHEARRQGMVTMRQDGVLKVLDGVIGLEALSEGAM